MLNLPADTPECDISFEAQQSPPIKHATARCYLPPMKLEETDSTQNHTPLVIRSRARNPSPSLSPNPSSYQQRAFSPAFIHGLPPPSSPLHCHPVRPTYHTQTHFTAAPQYHHHSCRKPILSLSPRGHPAQRLQYQDPYTITGVEVHHSRISRGHPRATQPRQTGANGISKPTKRGTQPSHSNKAYTQEQVHWLRYHHEDLHLIWPQTHARFFQIWPGEKRDSVPCITSRYYRSNLLPKLNNNGTPMLDQNGKFIMFPAKVRERAKDEGKDTPFLFVDLYPEWALVYNWVIPEHKDKAMRVLQILDGAIEDHEGKSQSKLPPLRA